jgi:hypothetical protein
MHKKTRYTYREKRTETRTASKPMDDGGPYQGQKILR